MAEPREPATRVAVVGYRIAGVAFLVAGVIFMTLGRSAMWIPMFTVGIVFLTLSATVGRTPAPKGSDEDAAPPST